MARKCPKCKETGGRAHLPDCSFAPDRSEREAFIKEHAVALVTELEAKVRRQAKELDSRETKVRYWRRAAEAYGDLNTWIAVKDGLPRQDAPYIVFCPSADPQSPFTCMAWYNPSFGWSLLPPCWIEAITHWMPVPGWPDDYLHEYEPS